MASIEEHKKKIVKHL